MKTRSRAQRSLLIFDNQQPDLAGGLRFCLFNNSYPSYGKKGYPISSGPMEGFCKQLGQRLKGPGARWNRKSVTPMAMRASLWANHQS